MPLDVGAFNLAIKTELKTVFLGILRGKGDLVRHDLKSRTDSRAQHFALVGTCSF